MDGKVALGGIVIIAIIVLIGLSATSLQASPAAQRVAPVFEEIGESMRAAGYEFATTGHLYEDAAVLTEAELAQSYGAALTYPTPSDHSIAKHGPLATALVKQCLEDIGPEEMLQREDPDAKFIYSICRLPDGRYGVSIDVDGLVRNVTRFVTRYKTVEAVVEYLGRSGAGPIE